MSLVSTISGRFKWRRFEPEVILLPAGWYLRFSLSYWDVEELLAERGIAVDETGNNRRLEASVGAVWSDPP
jgi:transposase-like protein